MHTLSWTNTGLYEQLSGELPRCVFPYTPDQLKDWLSSDYGAAVRAIARLPDRYRVALAVAVAATYAATDPQSSYLVLLLRWSADCPSCAECGARPAQKANIGGRADWRCVAHAREARAQEQEDIDRAVAKGARWLLRKRPHQLELFEEVV